MKSMSLLNYFCFTFHTVLVLLNDIIMHHYTLESLIPFPLVDLTLLLFVDQCSDILQYLSAPMI